MGTRVYVGRLPYDVRERDLEKFFKGYGRIREILLKNGFGFVEFDDYRDADDAVYELNGKDLLGERIIVAHARGTARGRSGGGGGGGGRDRDGGGRDRDGGGSRRRTNWIDKVSVEPARGSPHGSDLWRGGGGSSRHRSPRAPPPRNSRRSGRDKYGPPTRTEYRLIVENLSSRVSWQDLKDFMRQAGEVTYADAHKQHRNEGVVEFSSYTDMKNAIEKLSDTELNGRRIKLVEDKSHKSRRRSRSRSSHSRSRSRSSRRSRSRSPRSRSRSRSPRSRSKSKTSSRSRSPRSRSVSKSKSKSKSRSRSRSIRRSKSRSMSRGKSTEKSKSRSRSPAKSVKSEDRSSPLKVSKDED